MDGGMGGVADRARIPFFVSHCRASLSQPPLTALSTSTAIDVHACAVRVRNIPRNVVGVQDAARAHWMQIGACMLGTLLTCLVLCLECGWCAGRCTRSQGTCSGRTWCRGCKDPPSGLMPVPPPYHPVHSYHPDHPVPPVPPVLPPVPPRTLLRHPHYLPYHVPYHPCITSRTAHAPEGPWMQGCGITPYL